VRVLDLFCGAGGASRGYADAGFEVIGVDLKPFRRYPFRQYVDDALEFLEDIEPGEFELIHASPPCQGYSVTRHSTGREYPMLIAPVRERLLELGTPYVIENVEGARGHLVDPVMLCGSHFQLRTAEADGTILELRRHRLFETSFEVPAPYGGQCVHDPDAVVAGVYGGGPSRRTDPSDPGRRGGYTPVVETRRRLMRIDWMSRDELSEAIPPAYTRYIAERFLATRAS
jgi:DNA (cytosine-5)-methyltransferase 1